MSLPDDRLAVMDAESSNGGDDDAIGGEEIENPRPSMPPETLPAVSPDDPPGDLDIRPSGDGHAYVREPRDYPCQYCDVVFKSRQQRHYHVKIAKKCPGLKQAGIVLSSRKLEKNKSKGVPSVERPVDSTNGHGEPSIKKPSTQQGSVTGRRHSCPKCAKLFVKPSHVKRHLFTCRGPGFVRTSPLKMTSFSSMGSSVGDPRFSADPILLMRDRKRPSEALMRRRHTAPSAPKRSRASQSNFLGFPIDGISDLMRVVPQFLTLEGWTYNRLHDGLALIRCILDTDSLECHWSKTVVIRSALNQLDPTTFDIIIKSRVPGYDLQMLEEQTTKLTCVADVFDVMGIPLDEEEDEEDDDGFAPREMTSSLRKTVTSQFHRAPPIDAAVLAFDADLNGVVREGDCDDDATDDEIRSGGDDAIGTPTDAIAPSLVPKVRGKERVCRVCGVSGFAHRQALYRHIKKSHPRNQTWRCPICRADFSCQNTFLDHYDHHRVSAPEEGQSEAAAFEKDAIEKLSEEETEGVEEEEAPIESSCAPGVAAASNVPEDPSIEDGLDEDRGVNSKDGAGANSTAKRRRACGDCPPCRITENCEECTACKTRATSKQKCERRKCLNMLLTRPDDGQQYEVKQLLFAEWALQKTLSHSASNAPSTAAAASSDPLNEIVKEANPAKPGGETRIIKKTFWKCKLCDLTFPTKDKSVVLSHVATCHDETPSRGKNLRLLTD